MCCYKHGRESIVMAVSCCMVSTKQYNRLSQQQLLDVLFCSVSKELYCSVWHKLLIIIIIITMTIFMVLSSWLRLIARVHPVHATNAEQRQTAADLWTKPTDLSHRPACRLLGNHIHHRHLLLLGPKTDTHFTIDFLVIVFTIPQRLEGWVDGWLHTQTVYLPTSSHPSKQ